MPILRRELPPLAEQWRIFFSQPDWEEVDRENEERIRRTRTLPDYYSACLYAHQNAPGDPGPALAVVRSYQRRYGDEVLECAPVVLRHTMRGYRFFKLTGPDSYAFAALFERNLREHLRKNGPGSPRRRPAS